MTVSVTISHTTPGKVVFVDRTDLQGKFSERVANVLRGDDAVVAVWDTVKLVLTEQDIDA